MSQVSTRSEQARTCSTKVRLTEAIKHWETVHVKLCLPIDFKDALIWLHAQYVHTVKKDRDYVHQKKNTQMQKPSVSTSIRPFIHLQFL